MLTCDSDLASEQEVLHLHHFICNTWRSFESHGSGNAAHEIKNGTSKPGKDQELKKTPPEHREKLPPSYSRTIIFNSFIRKYENNS